MITRMDRVEGPNLILRLIQPEDAEYVHGLRTDPGYNAHLSFVTGTVADQGRWIGDYKAREAAGREFYYIIERRDGTRCGTVRLYEIRADSFTWGSWILDHNKPPKAALESAVLSFGAGFDGLGCERALVDVRRSNTHAEAFYRRLGMTEIGCTEQDIFFTYPCTRFRADQERHLTVLNGAVA